jgi:small ligand-binding sensory domain FIST
MSIRSSTGRSQHRNSRIAAQEAIAQARHGLNGPAVGLFLFGGIGHDQQELAHAAWEASGRIPMTGGSGEGGIGTGWSDESPFWVTATLLGGDGIQCRSGVQTGLQHDSHAIGAYVRARGIASDTKALFIFPDGITANVTALYHAFDGLDIPLLGGLTADDWLSEGRSWQYCDGQALTDSVSWLSVGGKVHVAWASHHGCRVFGGESLITRSQANRIWEIDNLPVMDFLKDCAFPSRFGQMDGVSLNIALFYQLPGSSDRRVTHIVIPQVGQSRQECIQIQPELPVGTKLWLARRDPASITEDLDILSEDLTIRLAGRTPKVLLHFDCAGRGQVMFSREQILRNLRHLQQAIPGVPSWSGFYSYGELAPSAHGNSYNNYSAVLAALSDP